MPIMQITLPIAVHTDPDDEFGVSVHLPDGEVQHLSDLVAADPRYLSDFPAGTSDDHERIFLAGTLALAANKRLITEEQFFRVADEFGFARYTF